MLKNSLFAAALCLSLNSFAVGNESSFNPAVSLILSGTYGQFNQASNLPATGFSMNPNPGHNQGFNIGESELGIAANIDPDFRGVATMALGATGTFSIENAFVQATSLGDGLNLKFGRFFSALGYLNEQHAHAWDFVDQPLVYATFWNNQLGEDGVQLKWLAPTELFMEIGGELGKGRSFPGTDTAKNGSNAGVIFAHFGDDIGTDHSWRAGASWQQTQRVAANSPDLSNPLITNSFSGNSQTAGVDFVWKYSANGNITERYLKVQGEYFQRQETGLLTYDATNTKSTDTFSVIQSGWYLQSVYQFMPRWRVAARYDQLNLGIAKVGTKNSGNIPSDVGYAPRRTSLMLDFSPSEFSRFRLQWANDQSQLGLADNQLFLQYIMSLGAHGAHSY